MASVRVSVKSQRDDESEVTHDARCEEIFKFCTDTQFKFLLNDWPSPGFTAVDVRYGSDALSKVDRTLERSIELIVIFAAGELT